MMLKYELLKKHEGFSSKVYRCTENKRTIGFGYNLDSDMLGISQDIYSRGEEEHITISEEEATEILIKCCDVFEDRLELIIRGYGSLSEEIKAALLNMIFNLGESRFKKFNKFINSVNRRDFQTAAIEMIDSRWFNQVKRRAVELVKYIQMD